MCGTEDPDIMKVRTLKGQRPTANGKNEGRGVVLMVSRSGNAVVRIAS